MMFALVVVACGRIGFDATSSATGDDANRDVFVPPTCNTQCGIAQYCSAPAFDCTGTPACVTMPAACEQIDDPVCGCDGITYMNSCEAKRAKASIASMGACASTANPTCSPPCNAQQFCGTPAGVCNAQPGTCLQKPMASDCDIPVATCGCDGVTYSNPCEAQINGASIAGTGLCSGGA